MNENTTQEPMVAEIVSIRLSAEDIERLRIDGHTQVDNNPKMELPQGPVFLNGQWIDIA
tara:strand:- start:134 stop:310 length:177 start_codon:yes stop_codon:yes gene_type:complete